MGEYTKKGLLFLMISVITSIIGVIVLYSFFFSFDFENITSENFVNLFITIIPGLIIAIIGGLFGLIGAILMLMGRKEFGEKHSKFIFYAIMIFIIAIIVSFVINSLSTFMVYSSSISQMPFGSDPSNTADLLRNNMYISVINTPITAALGGLIWVFGLYQLEDENGRTVLFATYVCMIVTAVLVSISLFLFFEDFINSANFEELMGSSSSSSYSQLFSSSSWIGNIGIISLVGGSISNILLFIALYIPYKRITSGELAPVKTAYQNSIKSSRYCPNCGRLIPEDAETCPYCGRKFW